MEYRYAALFGNNSQCTLAHKGHSKNHHCTWPLSKSPVNGFVSNCGQLAPPSIHPPTHPPLSPPTPPLVEPTTSTVVVAHAANTEAKINEQGVLASAAKLTEHAQTGKGGKVRTKGARKVQGNSVGDSYNKADSKNG